ncbi:LPS export ABC transporter periplasmic protein LptC [Terricaulis sp.]|uniref:LPS export ABC transporter periplasmic protein LptC n=1 Tax=Terricaulis sp. TaxID=2768686 RepID=UPI0037830334
MSLSAAADFVWEPKRALSLKAARKRSQLIAILRRVFVACAGASFASVFVFMALYAVEGGFEANQFAATEPLRMINPRFTGRTESGGPYQITAEIAERAPGENQPIELVAPVYRTEAGTIMLAPRGVYDEQKKTVVFRGEVLFSDRGGNRFTTPDLTVDLDRGVLIGQRGVTGAGPLGVLQADTYELRESDRALVLRGSVRGQIPDRGRQNEEPSQ